MENVLIVGGGTAGWITAALLNATLNRGDKRVNISLIESPAVPRIGVGEATIPSIRRTLATIGVKESDFLKATGATFKHGIRFDNWLSDGHQYYHPFHRISEEGANLAPLYWLASDRKAPFHDAVSPQPRLAEAGLSPKHPDRFYDYRGDVTYAYHLDAEKFADFLRYVSCERGVQYTRDDVTKVNMGDDGNIVSVSTAKSGDLAADLFIDCTGFKRLLIGEQLGATFQSASQYLLCDSAITTRVELAEDEVAEPFTKSTALSAGWCWDIGLQTRRGIGYVYSSKHLDREAAEAELRAAKNLPADTSFNDIRFETGCLEQQWVKNCVAIGLSAGFIEPLESTGIALIETAAGYLSQVFPWGETSGASAEIFNERMAARFHECMDFINLHYVLNQKSGTGFWHDARQPERMTPSLQKLLDLWDDRVPSALDFPDSQRIFPYASYEYVLYGMQWGPARWPGASSEERRFVFPRVEKMAEAMLAGMIPHADALQRLTQSEEA